MKNFIAKGKVLAAIAAAPTTGGSLVKVGSLIGVAASDALTGDGMEVIICGVFEIPKAAEAVSQGDKLYYADATSNLTKTAAGNTFAGFAYESAAAGSLTVNLLLANGI